MSCFATKTPIPLRNPIERPRIFTVLIDDHIWIFCSDKSGMELHKFNINTFQLEVVNCLFPSEFERFRCKITSDQQNIYVIVCGDRPLDREQGSTLEVTPMFKFDTNTSQWEFVTNYSFVSVSWLGPIVDNQMHFVQYLLSPRQKLLIKLDLVTKEVEQTVFQDANLAVRNVVVENGQVYVMLNSLEYGATHVSRIINENLEVLNIYRWNNIEGRALVRKYNTVENGYVLGVRRPIDSSDAETVYIDVFDSTTMNWNRTSLPGFVRKGTRCFSNVIIKEDKIFAVFMERSGKRIKFSIQMYETASSLSTICMLDLIDKNNDASVVEPIIESLSVSLKNKLTNMLQWRIAENQIKLEKRQRAGVVGEIRKMEDDELVDHRMQRMFQAEFDSNFSDSGDSDIIDFDVEPHESTDDDDNSTDDEDNIVNAFFPGLGRVDERNMEIL